LEWAAHSHVTLVLGAGGVVGRAFHAGVLRALAERRGWDARRADLVVGTSAGAQVGALLRLGWTPRALFDRASAPPMHKRGARGRRAWPASMAYLRSVYAAPRRARIGPLVAALLPEAEGGDDRLGDGFDDLGDGWPDEPLWIPAIDLDRGERVVFGRADAPAVSVVAAVCSSSAVPGMNRPVHIGAHRYVDGGITSATHADLAASPSDAIGALPRVALVLSPLSRFLPMRWLLRRELRALARVGIETIVFEPDRALGVAMGWNPLDPARARAVAALAYDQTLARLRDQ
jgi:NTE family protein